MHEPSRSTAIDFAVAAYREEGVWQVQRARPRRARRRRRASRTRCAGSPVTAARSAWSRSTRTSSCVVRVAGADVRILLSDVTAADEWELARSAVEHLGLPDARGRRRPGARPATSTCSATSGMHAMDMARPARRLRPLPRRDALRRRPPARLRPAVRRGRRPRLGLTRRCPTHAGDDARDARRARRGARRRLATGDVPIGAVVLDPDGDGDRPRPQRPRGATPTPPAHAEVVALRAAAAAPRRVAARRLHARRHARAVHDVRRRRSCWPGSTASSSARTTPKAGAVGSPVGRGPRPPAQPPPRGGRRRARRGVDGPAGRVLPEPAGPHRRGLTAARSVLPPIDLGPTVLRATGLRPNGTLCPVGALAAVQRSRCGQLVVASSQSGDSSYDRRHRSVGAG